MRVCGYRVASAPDRNALLTLSVRREPALFARTIQSTLVSTASAAARGPLATEARMAHRSPTLCTVNLLEGDRSGQGQEGEGQEGQEGQEGELARDPDVIVAPEQEQLTGATSS
jgi:hypothetical protein